MDHPAAEILSANEGFEGSRFSLSLSRQDVVRQQPLSLLVHPLVLKFVLVITTTMSSRGKTATLFPPLPDM